MFGHVQVFIRPRPHYAGGIWKRSFMSTFRPSVHTNPSRKQSFNFEKSLQTGEIWKRRLCVLVWIDITFNNEAFRKFRAEHVISMREFWRRGSGFCFEKCGNFVDRVNKKATNFIYAFLIFPVNVSANKRGNQRQTRLHGRVTTCKNTFFSWNPPVCRKSCPPSPKWIFITRGSKGYES